MGKTDQILTEIGRVRDTQAKTFDKIEDLRKEVNEKHLTVVEQIGCLKSDIATNRLRSGLFGTIGGAITIGLALTGLFIKNFFISGGK